MKIGKLSSVFSHPFTGFPTLMVFPTPTIGFPYLQENTYMKIIQEKVLRGLGPRTAFLFESSGASPPNPRYSHPGSYARHVSILPGQRGQPQFASLPELAVAASKRCAFSQ